MLRSLLLTTALLAGLAAPALSQSTQSPSSASRPAAPPAAATTPVRPTTPGAGTVPAPTANAPATPSPSPAAPPRTTTATTATPAVVATGRRIDVNGASETDLASLPGIGPVTAKNIVAGRPWDDLADLVKKKAMAQSTFDRNKAMFALADINKSSVADMAKTLPGIGDARARKIVDGRPYAKADDLVGKKVLTQAQFDKIKDVVTY